MIKSKILLLILLLSSPWAFSQSSDNGGADNGDSPNQSKGSSGSNLINVDLFTGTASVNIPIHGFTVDGLNAGVSLSYVAKGIRVDELASSVGLGWNLNAGGSISREVHGIEDEVTLDAYFKFGAQINPPDPSTYDYYEGVLVPGATPYSSDPNTNIDDVSYDVFHVNVLGRSFKFSMKYDPVFPHPLIAICQPHNEVKIEVINEDFNQALTQVVATSNTIPNNSGMSEYEGIIKFVITDEKGNRFFFERGNYEYKEYNVDEWTLYDNIGNYYATQTWDLTKVITVSGREINYVYEKTYIEYLANVTETFSELPEDIDWNANPPVVNYDPLEIEEQYWKGYKTHLKEIIYPNNTKVSFILNNGSTSINTARMDCPGDYLVMQIEVEHTDNANVSNKMIYDLQHSYFNTPSYGYSGIELPYNTFVSSVSSAISFPNTDLRNLHHIRGMRLKLNQIYKIGFDGTTSELYYKFGYNSTPLPYRFAPNKDYYGFYNGKTATPYVRDQLLDDNYTESLYLSIPYHADVNGYANIDVHSTNWGLDRSHDYIYAQAFVLNEIENAYTGKETLTYQDYTLSNPTCQYNYHANIAKCANSTEIQCDIDPLLEGVNVNDGLCIGTIKYENAYGPSHTYTMQYILSQGVRFYRGGYTSYKRYFPQHGWGWVFTNHFISQRDYLNGSNHGFSKVEVKKTTALGTNVLDHKAYYFSNLMYDDLNYPYNNNKRSALTKLTYEPYRTFPGDFEKHRVGLLEKEEEYDENNNLLFKKEFNYTEVFDSSPYAYNYYMEQKHSAGTTCFTGAARFDFYVIDDKRMLLTSEQTTRYINIHNTSSTGTMVMDYSYVYDDFDNIKEISWTDSKGDTYKKIKKYNYDFGNVAPGKQFLLSSEVWKTNGSALDQLLDIQITAPSAGSSTVFFNGFFSLINTEPISSTSALPMTGATASAIKLDNILDYKNQSDYGYRILKRKEFTQTSNYGDVLEARLNDQDLYTSSLYDGASRKVAEVSNAQFKDIAFTSFETQNGRWVFSNNDVVHLPSTALTGEHVFSLIQNTNDITSSGLSDIDYISAIWVNSQDIPTAELVDGGGNTSPVQLALMNTVGDWKLYVANFTGATGTNLKISNSGTNTMYIDEIRLHPRHATMETFTYKPLCGVASESDGRNYITYYEYDQFGRLSITRNMRGNIISKLEQFAQHNDQ